MSEITVTMSLKEYEKLKKDLKEANDRSVYRYIKREYSNIEKNEYKTTLDVERIKKYVNEHGIYQLN